jgi:hypothetical protein
MAKIYCDLRATPVRPVGITYSFFSAYAKLTAGRPLAGHVT